MLMEAFLLTPYLAIAASFALAGTVAMICYTQPVPRGAGFTGLKFPGASWPASPKRFAISGLR